MDGAPPASTASSADEEKKKAKLARLEAWKKEQGAKKALSEAKAKAAALAAGKSASGEYICHPLCLLLQISHHLIAFYRYRHYSTCNTSISPSQANCPTQSGSSDWTRSKRATNKT
jgi:hypothetical protein